MGFTEMNSNKTPYPQFSPFSPSRFSPFNLLFLAAIVAFTAIAANLLIAPFAHATVYASSGASELSIKRGDTVIADSHRIVFSNVAATGVNGGLEAKFDVYDTSGNKVKTVYLSEPAAVAGAATGGTAGTTNTGNALASYNTPSEYKAPTFTLKVDDVSSAGLGQAKIVVYTPQEAAAASAAAASAAITAAPATTTAASSAVFVYGGGASAPAASEADACIMHPAKVTLKKTQSQEFIVTCFKKGMAANCPGSSLKWTTDAGPASIELSATPSPTQRAQLIAVYPGLGRYVKASYGGSPDSLKKDSFECGAKIDVLETTLTAEPTVEPTVKPVAVENPFATAAAAESAEIASSESGILIEPFMTFMNPPKTFSLKRGWNLISTAFANAKISTTCGAQKPLKLWNYDSAAKRYDSPGYLGSATLEPGKGYWVYAAGDCEWTVDYVYDETPYYLEGLALHYGWNQIGGPNYETALSELTRGSNCDVLSAYGFDAATNSYVKTGVLEPGQGYFVRVKGDCSFAAKRGSCKSPSGGSGDASGITSWTEDC